MKSWICIVTGALGGVVAAAFGGWTYLLTTLCILMAVDYASGLVVAGVFHKSPKSPSGGLESHAGLKGLVRKIGMLCLVMVAHLIDRMLGTEYIRDATTIAFSINEIISILENAGLMGIKMPAVLVKALDVLRQKAGEESTAEHKQAADDGGIEAVSDGWPADEMDEAATAAEFPEPAAEISEEAME